LFCLDEKKEVLPFLHEKQEKITALWVGSEPETSSLEDRRFISMFPEEIIK